MQVQFCSPLFVTLPLSQMPVLFSPATDRYSPVASTTAQRWAAVSKAALDVITFRLTRSDRPQGAHTGIHGVIPPLPKGDSARANDHGNDQDDGGNDRSVWENTGGEWFDNREGARGRGERSSRPERSSVFSANKQSVRAPQGPWPMLTVEEVFLVNAPL